MSSSTSALGRCARIARPGAGFFYALELVGDLDGGAFSDTARADLISGLIPRRLREAGLLARVYNRAAPLVQIAPPLISDRALLDRIAEIIADTLDEASARLYCAGPGDNPRTSGRKAGPST